jgi:hypothetical protein
MIDFSQILASCSKLKRTVLSPTTYLGNNNFMNVKPKMYYLTIIYSMDLRTMNELGPVLKEQLKRPYKNLQFIHECLGRRLANEQGYLASGLQLYATNDITIKENIMVHICLNNLKIYILKK